MAGGRRALVLGGGGVTGVAWELGILAGLAEAGVDMAPADLLVGTSAGSVVAAQVTSGIPVEKLYEEQLADPTGEIAAKLGLSFMSRWLLFGFLPGDDQAARARYGRAALRTRTVPEAERLAVFDRRLPSKEWPARDLKIVAVDAQTGDVAVFDRSSGVELKLAVAASCAVPMVWPPVTIGSHRYVDGGVRSPTNADLATGCDRVIVVAPLTAAFRASARLSNQLASLGGEVKVAVVTPDKAALQAIGNNVLDPSRRAAAARAGRAQAGSEVAAVRATWEG